MHPYAVPIQKKVVTLNINAFGKKERLIDIMKLNRGCFQAKVDSQAVAHLLGKRRQLPRVLIGGVPNSQLVPHHDMEDPEEGSGSSGSEEEWGAECKGNF